MQNAKPDLSKYTLVRFHSDPWHVRHGYLLVNNDSLQYVRRMLDSQLKLGYFHAWQEDPATEERIRIANEK